MATQNLTSPAAVVPRGLNAQGSTHSRQDVADELGDVAFVARVAAASLGHDPRKVLAQVATKVRSRLTGPSPTPPPTDQPANPETTLNDDFTSTLPRKRMGAGLLITDPAGRVLLVEPTYKVDWEIPGGAVEADESPRATTIREIGEELGFTASPGRLLVVDWVPPRDGRTEGLMLLFDGGALTPAQTSTILLPPDELRSWAWCDEQQAEQRLSALLARRVAAAIQARADGGTAYLENGYRATGTNR